MGRRRRDGRSHLDTRVKLTEPQRQHMHDLCVAADRPQPESAALVKHGLAQTGKGRYGEWVRLTQKGLDLVKSAPIHERVAREAQTIARSLESDDTLDARGAAQRNELLGMSPVPSTARGEKQAARKSASKAATSPPAAPLQAGEPPSNSTPAKLPKQLAVSTVAPNAVRITHGRSYIYYPLSSFGKLNDASKIRVRTRCPLNRPRPVASPESLEDVLC